MSKSTTTLLIVSRASVTSLIVGLTTDPCILAGPVTTCTSFEFVNNTEVLSIENVAPSGLIVGDTTLPIAVISSSVDSIAVNVVDTPSIVAIVLYGNLGLTVAPLIVISAVADTTDVFATAH